MKPTTSIELPIETLNSLKEALPHGSIERIAELTDYSRQYIHNVFEGTAKINSDNYKIIQEAQKIVRTAKEEAAAINNDIKKTLGKQ